MAIREKDLTAFSDPIRLVDDETTELRSIGEALQRCAEEFGAEVKIKNEAVERGFFDSNPIPCLQICHPNHEKDYFNFCITCKQQGKTRLVQIYTYGKSKQMGLEAFQKNTRAFDGSGVRGTAVGALRGGALGAGFAIGSAVGGVVKGTGKLLAKGVAAMMCDDAALSVEKDWYDLMATVLQNVFMG